MRNAKGLSLISVLVGTLLGGLAIFAGIQVLSTFQNASNRRIADSNAVSQSSSIGTYLKSNFEGTKSFQNLSLKISLGSGASISSRGAGFIVEKDAGVDGTVIPSNCLGRFHRITFAVKDPLPTDVKLAQPLSSGNFQITAGTYLPNPENIFPQNQLLVVSNVSTSEPIFLNSPIAYPTNFVRAGVNGELKLPITNEMKYFLPGGNFQGEYLVGDPVYKLRLVRLGVELTDNTHCIGTLKAISVAPTLNGFNNLASAPISIGVNRFNAEPILDSNTSRCSIINDQNKNNIDFAALNTDSTGYCYSIVKQLKTKYSLVYYASEGRGLASQLESGAKTREESGEYLFTTNR